MLKLDNVTSILFDMDGTLADTVHDLTHALNLQLQQHGLATINSDTIRPVISFGSRRIVATGFGIEEDDPNMPALRQEFFDLYEANIHHHTTLFAGLDAMLSRIVARSMPWGIVSNKPHYLCEKAIVKLNIQPGCMLGGDSLAVKKPHPAPLLKASELLGVNPEHCVYIGDAKTDIIAAKAAGMQSIAAAYGYIPEGDDATTWDADAIANNINELSELLKI